MGRKKQLPDRKLTDEDIILITEEKINYDLDCDIELELF